MTERLFSRRSDPLTSVDGCVHTRRGRRAGRTPAPLPPTMVIGRGEGPGPSQPGATGETPQRSAVSGPLGGIDPRIDRRSKGEFIRDQAEQPDACASQPRSARFVGECCGSGSTEGVSGKSLFCSLRRSCPSGDFCTPDSTGPGGAPAGLQSFHPVFLLRLLERFVQTRAAYGGKLANF